MLLLLLLHVGLHGCFFRHNQGTLKLLASCLTFSVFLCTQKVLFCNKRDQT